MTYQTAYRTVVLLALCLMIPRLAAGRDETRQQEKTVGPCSRCPGVFVGMPDSLPSQASIAPEDEPGTKLKISGEVRDVSGDAAAGIIVYAYQTDDRGNYPTDRRYVGTAAARHGRLRAWVQTDAQGRYRFETIRPGGYPGSGIPQHIHMHIIEPNRCIYGISDINFTDDPRLSDRARQRLTTGRGGSGLVSPTQNDDGSESVTRDIVLGENIPGYDECG